MHASREAASGCARCGQPARRFDGRASAALVVLGLVTLWWLVGFVFLGIGLWLRTRSTRLCAACRGLESG